MKNFVALNEKRRVITTFDKIIDFIILKYTPFKVELITGNPTFLIPL